MGFGDSNIAARPGMGESRTIIDQSGDLSSPWRVIPTSGSVLTIAYLPGNISVYQNVLSGDGPVAFGQRRRG